MTSTESAIFRAACNSTRTTWTFWWRSTGSADALKVAESSRARVLTEMLGGSGRRPRRGCVPHDYRKLARASNNIFLSYWLAPARSFLWVITPSRIATFKLPPRARDRSACERLRGAIEGLP